MEIVLQWLDDLDDFVFAAALSWRNACRVGLALGLMAAFVLTPIYGTELSLPSVALLSAVASASVFAWVVAAMITIRRQTPQVSAAA